MVPTDWGEAQGVGRMDTRVGEARRGFGLGVKPTCQPFAACSKVFRGPTWACPALRFLTSQTSRFERRPHVLKLLETRLKHRHTHTRPMGHASKWNALNSLEAPKAAPADWCPKPHQKNSSAPKHPRAAGISRTQGILVDLRSSPKWTDAHDGSDDPDGSPMARCA